MIVFKHIDKTEGSLIEYGTSKSEIPFELIEAASAVIEKAYPIAFKGTGLQQYLEDNKTDKLYITGFNMEFCVLFTSVAAADRGYEVVVIEDLCGTVNDENTYEMEGLDIVDFTGSVIDWSGVIENQYLEESKFSNLKL
ncbi:isochorismatase family cysteine hydrolase [Salinicoccus sp. HZC-1]|uniref:isochorismatase family cysteine hydrolase n=1 Tax=Salinicoccus sp. HZC-1 TaxID=3385497 RepID=UPI00398BA3D6